MARTKITKNMREIALHRMNLELLRPRIDQAKEVLGRTLHAFLQDLCGPEVLAAYAKFPDYFETVSATDVSRRAEERWQGRMSIPFDTVPITKELQHQLDIDSLANGKRFPKSERFALVCVALKSLRRVLDECDEFKTEADRILSGIRCVEDLQSEYPEAMKWIDVPNKPAPLMVRPGALKNLVANLK